MSNIDPDREPRPTRRFRAFWVELKRSASFRGAFIALGVIMLGAAVALHDAIWMTIYAFVPWDKFDISSFLGTLFATLLTIGSAVAIAFYQVDKEERRTRKQLRNLFHQTQRQIKAQAQLWIDQVTTAQNHTTRTFLAMLAPLEKEFTENCERALNEAYDTSRRWRSTAEEALVTEVAEINSLFQDGVLVPDLRISGIDVGRIAASHKSLADEALAAAFNSRTVAERFVRAMEVRRRRAALMLIKELVPAISEFDALDHAWVAFDGEFQKRIAPFPSVAFSQPAEKVRAAFDQVLSGVAAIKQTIAATFETASPFSGDTTEPQRMIVLASLLSVERILQTANPPSQRMAERLGSVAQAVIGAGRKLMLRIDLYERLILPKQFSFPELTYAGQPLLTEKTAQTAATAMRQLLEGPSAINLSPEIPALAYLLMAELDPLVAAPGKKARSFKIMCGRGASLLGLLIKIHSEVSADLKAQIPEKYRQPDTWAPLLARLNAVEVIDDDLAIPAE